MPRLILVALAALAASVGWGRVGALPPPAPNTDLARLVDPAEAIRSSFVLPATEVDYLYSEALGSPYVTVRSFTTLGRWLEIRGALDQVPPWVERWPVEQGAGPVFAPAVAHVGQRYVMWFSAFYDNPAPYGGQRFPRCIGYATSSSPLGPFSAPDQPAPPLCQFDEFGDTDPRPARFDHQWWLYFTSENERDPGAAHTMVWAERLASDGTTLVGQPHPIFTSEKPWENHVVDAPQMVEVRGRWFLFFSGGGAYQPGAGIGEATCAGPGGPCRSQSAGPWLGSNALGGGPSEESLFSQGGAQWMVFTARALYRRGEQPHLAVARVAFSRAGVYLAAFGAARPGPPAQRAPRLPGASRGHRPTPNA